MSQLKNFLLQTLQKISPINLVIFSILIVAAVFVRLNGINEYAFNDDELWHLVISNQSNLWEVIQSNFRQEVHPPLSYIVWHYMLKISHNDLWLRMSALIPSILLIPSAYIFGRRYIGRAAAYFLVFLFAFGAIPISMGVIIRAYSMMMLVLIWALIFVDKFKTDHNKKYLIYYFLCCLAAIELNHSAAFCILSLGLILLFRAFRDKNYCDFVTIAAMHAILGALVLGYAFVLKHYYGFSGVIPGFYESYGDPLYYPSNYMKLFFWFPIGSEINDSFAGIFSLFAIIALFVTPIALIRARKWLLLQLFLTPIIAITITDSLRIFPFSPITRNNLFLFISIAIGYAYLAQILTNFVAKFYEKKWLEGKDKIVFVLQTTAVVITAIFFVGYVISHDSFRKTSPSCAEMSITKSDNELLDKTFKSKNSPDNVFVTAARNIWNFQMQSAGGGKIEVITKHLAKFKNDQTEIYFTAFPARDFSTNVDMLAYKLFFTDLFSCLKSENKLDKIKSFTFFDNGLVVDYLTMNFLPQMIPDKLILFPTAEDKMNYKISQEGYNIAWAIHSSKEVLDIVYQRDRSFSCGREVLFLTFSPKFVEQEFIKKDFIDGREFRKKQRGL